MFSAYFIAIGFYRLKDYERVIARSEKILKIEPDNHQVNFCYGIECRPFVKTAFVP